MKFNKKYISLNILLLLIGCLLAILLLEGLLRIYQPIPFRVKGDKIILPANQKYLIKNNNSEKLDEFVVHKKNVLGFRGNPPPDNFDKYLTIVTIGGSTTECTLLSDGKDWPAILEKLLKKDFVQSWINNAGFDGFSTFGCLFLMKDIIVNLKPKIALFLIGLNDIELEELFEKRYFQNPFPTVREYISQNSEVYSLLVNFYRMTFAIKNRLMMLEVNLREIPQMAHTEEKYAMKMILMHENKYLTPYGNRVKAIINIARKYGIDPILVTQPALYGNSIDDITKVNLNFIKVGDISGGLRWEILQLYNNVVRQIGLQEKVLVIDLAENLPKSSRYYYDFIHYSNEWAEKVAQLIYQDLSPYLAKNYHNLAKGAE